MCIMLLVGRLDSLIIWTNMPPACPRTTQSYPPQLEENA